MIRGVFNWPSLDGGRLQGDCLLVVGRNVLVLGEFSSSYYSPSRTGATEGAMRGGAAVRSLTGAQKNGQIAAIMNVGHY